MKYYLLTLIRVPVNLFPRVFYWKFHYYFMFFVFFVLSNPGGISYERWQNFAISRWSFLPSSSERVNWGINASKNRIVCLRRAPSFFSSPPRLDVWCFPSHTETYEPISELRHSTPHLSHKRTHTPRCCGSETQPECDRTLLRYASRKFGEGRAPPMNSQNAPLHLQFLLTPRNESRLCSSSSGFLLKIKSNHTYSCFFPQIQVLSYSLIVWEPASRHMAQGGIIRGVHQISSRLEALHHSHVWRRVHYLWRSCCRYQQFYRRW